MINKENLVINEDEIQIIGKCNSFPVCYIKIVKCSNKELNYDANFNNGKKISATNNSRETNVVTNKKNLENNVTIN